MSGKTFILLSLINWRGAFLYLCWKKRRSCLKGNWSSFVGKCIQNGSRSTSILAYDSSVILWQHWKISTLMSPFPLPPETQLNWRHMNLFKIVFHFYWVIKQVLFFWSIMLLQIPSPFIKNFLELFSLSARGLLYSIGREAERAHRLYQYFERVCEIRHTWKLKTTQTVGPTQKYIF